MGTGGCVGAVSQPENIITDRRRSGLSFEMMRRDMEIEEMKDAARVGNTAASAIQRAVER
jgi:hypothetical protein